MTRELSAALGAFEQAEQLCYSLAGSLELAGDAADPLAIIQIRLAAHLAGMLADSLREISQELTHVPPSRV